jgi:hypothetical protein
VALEAVHAVHLAVLRLDSLTTEEVVLETPLVAAAVAVRKDALGSTLVEVRRITVRVRNKKRK